MNTPFWSILTQMFPVKSSIMLEILLLARFTSWQNRGLFCKNPVTGLYTKIPIPSQPINKRWSRLI
ncbi:Uncharacterised protein [Segatella copri]|nr:Uncharacterised protein [Segatella copri]